MADSEKPGSPAEAIFMGLLLLGMFASLFIGLKTPETVVFFCLVLVWNVGLVDSEEALSGFSNEGMLAVGALFVVIVGVEKSQLADKAARKVFGLRTSMSAGLARMMGLCLFLSAFLNNTPVVALFIPIVRDWARARGFNPSVFLIPLSFACIMGGLLTVIGTSTNLVVQGLVIDESANDPSIEAIGFFEPGYVGLPLALCGTLYLTIFAPRLLKNRGGGLFRYVRDRAKDLLTEVQVMDDFPYTGDPVGLMLSKLGLPLDTLIKIRRKLSPGILRQMSQNLEEDANMGKPESTLSPSAKEGATHHEQGKNVNAILEANQRCFKAECLYSYRMKAERLWGTKDDLALAHAAVTDVNTAYGEFTHLLRKRWVSDMDARPNSDGGNGLFNGPVEPFTGPVEGETYTDVFPVSAAEAVQAGDILFLSCPQSTMVDFQSAAVSQRLKGLKFLDVSALDLPGHGTEFFEIVLSGHNHFLGRSARRDNAEFAAYYNVSVVAVRCRGQAEASNPASVGSAPASFSQPVGDAPEAFLEGGFQPALKTESSEVPPLYTSSAKTSSWNGHAVSWGMSLLPAMETSRKNTLTREDEKDVTETSFKSGDVVLVLAKEEFMEKYGSSKDFFLITKVGSVPKPVRFFDYLPLVLFAGMLAWVFTGIGMVQASFAAGAILIFGGWVDAKKTVGYVDWALLLLIGSALGLSKGIVNSGLANYVGVAIRNSGLSPDASLFLMFMFTMMCTELITNNAAAALSTPIAFSIARELEVSYKPFILGVMIAASCSYLTPIGYQTNTLVWGPGGYKFSDFMRIGTALSVIYLALGTLLLPRIFPF